MPKNRDMAYLMHRVEELEEKVRQLRLSRRVLMGLVERLEREKSQSGARMEKENRKLQRSNYKYAVSILHKNRRIVELEKKLK